MSLKLIQQSKELLMAVTDLASILDQPVDTNGMIRLRYIYASQIINTALIQSREIVSEIEAELTK